MLCWFALFRGPDAVVGDDELNWLNRFLAATPGLHKGLIFTPSSTSDPYLHDGPPPMLGVQLYFNDIEQLEAAAAKDGHLHALARRETLHGADVTHQAMLVRRFPVPEPAFRTPSGELPCTYLVSYEGAAEDHHGWLAHYIASHPPIMARFPGIREIEIYTRIDWCRFLPWSHVEHMQRNKVVFDSPMALTEALNSPVRHEMRADFAKFPPFTGPNTHFPMATRTVSASPL